MASKKNKLIISSAIIILAVILSVAAYLVLPDTLVMQITLSGAGGTTMPKLSGILITLAICVVFSVLYYVNDNNSKYLILCVIGICLYGLMFIINL